MQNMGNVVVYKTRVLILSTLIGSWMDADQNKRTHAAMSCLFHSLNSYWKSVKEMY